MHGQECHNMVWILVGNTQMPLPLIVVRPAGTCLVEGKVPASWLRCLRPGKGIVLHKILLSDFTLSGNWWFLYCDKKTRRTKTQIRFLGKEEYNEPWRRKTCIGEFSNWCTSCTQGFYIAPCGPIFNITRSADLVSPYWQAKRRKNYKNCMPCFAFK